MKAVLIILGSLAGLFVIGFAVLFVQSLNEGRYYAENCRLLTTDTNYTVRTGSGTVTVTQQPDRRKYLCPDGKVHWF